MDNITLGQILETLTFISAFIGVILGLMKYSSTVIKKQIEKTLEPVNKSITSLDVAQCKNFLVRFLSDVEQGNVLDEVEKERAYEVYDHYTNDLKQNSYIHRRWNELMEKEGK